MLASYDICEEKKEEECNHEKEEEEECSMANAMMQRGAYLRMLRQMELEDEAERQRQEKNENNDIQKSLQEFVDCGDTASLSSYSSDDTNSVTNAAALEDQIGVISSSDGLATYKMLNYDSYLAHQRYYNDLKHINMNFIDYGMIRNSNGCDGGRLIIEQRKALGKGGLCWDAAYILAEYMIQHEKDWILSNNNNNNNNNNTNESSITTKVVELGSGTGLGGLMIAKAIPNCHVSITDLPELMDLMTCNIRRNFDQQHDSPSCQNYQNPLDSFTNITSSLGNASAKTLRWGVQEDYQNGPYDIVIGCDVVASLYDPIALAQTFYALSHDKTKIYVSAKLRLDKPHELFEEEMRRLFGKVTVISCLEEKFSKIKNPNMRIIVAEGPVR
mmetsp:Transcript_20709/g.30314  ORF Transcript_20709/g.30314 Transcript_20709/m.30314 type:complete len:387 (+) Transcript_20709:176-1336(+)